MFSAIPIMVAQTQPAAQPTSVGGFRGLFLAAWLGRLGVPVPGEQAVIVQRTFNDIADLVDEFLKREQHGQEESQAHEDAFVKFLNKTELEDQSLDEDVLTKALQKVLGEQQDVSDQALVFVNYYVAIIETLFIADEFVKLIGAVQGDEATTQDAFTKVESHVHDDKQDVSDQLNAFKILVLLVQDLADIRDELTKAQAATQADDAPTEDALIKSVRKMVDDNVFITDQTDTTQLIGLVILEVMDLLDLRDEFVKTQGSVQGDDAATDDALTKAISKTVAENQDVMDQIETMRRMLLSDEVSLTELVNTFRILILQVLEELALADEFTKQHRVDLSDLPLVEDAFTKAVRKILSDEVFISDQVSFTQIIGLVILEVMDLLDLRDEFVKQERHAMTEDQETDDAFVKRIQKVVEEMQHVNDEIALLRTLLLSDTVTLTDTMEFYRVLNLAIIELQDVRDEFVKLLSMKYGDDQVSEDAVVKQLAKAIEDRLDLAEALVVQRIVQLALNENQDVSETLLRSISLVLGDEAVTQDALVKLIAKVIDEEQAVSDDILLSVLFAVIVVAEYLETRLSGHADLQKRLSNVRDSIVRKIRDIDPMGRKPGTKGFKR